MNKKMIISIAFFIVCIFSFVLFFGIGHQNEISICAFIFTLLTEIVCYGNVLLLTNEKQNTFSVAGLSSILFIYVLCSIMFNVFFVSIFHTLRSIIIFNISILLIYLFFYMMVLLFKKEGK